MEEGRENNKDYYSGVKIYNDGSHYIGIPHTENPKRKRYRLKPQEEVITVTESKDDEKSVITYENGTDDQTVGQTERTPTVRQTTRKELFDALYRQFCGLRYKERKAKISEAMEQYFSSSEELSYFMERNFERKKETR